MSEGAILTKVDILTAQLRDEKQRSSELDAIIVETETTIAQFRDLVANLQRSVQSSPWRRSPLTNVSEVETLRVQQASQEFMTETTSKEAHAIMNMNLKLQSTATKTQNKTIDIELKKLEAAQLSEHLRIVHVSDLQPTAIQHTTRHVDDFRRTFRMLMRRVKQIPPRCI